MAYAAGIRVSSQTIIITSVDHVCYTWLQGASKVPARCATDCPLHGASTCPRTWLLGHYNVGVCLLPVSNSTGHLGTLSAWVISYIASFHLFSLQSLHVACTPPIPLQIFKDHHHDLNSQSFFEHVQVVYCRDLY